MARKYERLEKIVKETLVCLPERMRCHEAARMLQPY